MNRNQLAGRDLLRLLDLTPEEFRFVVQTALDQKEDWKVRGIHKAPQAGKAVAIIMEKPSLRTRSSFEIGVRRLGAHPLVLDDDHSAFSRGETVQDTVHWPEPYETMDDANSYAPGHNDITSRYSALDSIVKQGR